MLAEPEKAVKCTIKPGATSNKSASRDVLQMSNSTHTKDRQDESEPSMEGFESYVSSINLRLAISSSVYVKFPLCEHSIIGSDTGIKPE